jgi:hypothetical protein
MLNTLLHEWSRLETLCNELLYIISFDVYTVSITLFDATKHNFKVSHVHYIWTIFTAEYNLTRKITAINAL